MKTGETVRDGRGRTFQVGQLLGRGLWGRTYGAREDSSGERWVLKVPHSAADLDNDESLFEACRTIALEQARLLESGDVPGFVQCDARFSLPDGTPVLVQPRAHTTFAQRIAAGCSFEELVATCVGVVKVLRGLKEPLPFHGDLHPGNVLLDERGQVLLADPVTPTLRRALPALLGRQRAESAFLAPEVRDAVGTVPLGPTADSYSVGMILYRGLVASSEGGIERFPDLPLDGLDKARLVALKDHVTNRLKNEHSNPRFHTRMSDRTAALLNRAVSRETSPSPPYRFRRLDELQNRLTEVLALVHPAVTAVGRLIPEATDDDTFTTEDDVGFTVTVGCTPGVETHEELACGLAVFDADLDERVREFQAAYTVDRHPSGRFRFRFKLSELGPGRHRIRVAFTIRESGDEPMTAEGEFRIQPAPGYMPPPEKPAPAPLTLERSDDPISATEPGVVRSERGPARPLPAQAPRPFTAPPPVTRAASTPPPANHGAKPPPTGAFALAGGAGAPRPGQGGPGAATVTPPIQPVEPRRRTAEAPALKLDPHRSDTRRPEPRRPQQHRPDPIAPPARTPTGAKASAAPRRIEPRRAQTGAGMHGGTRPGVPAGAAQASAASSHAEPEFKGTGRWSELPLPGNAAEDLRRPGTNSMGATAGGAPSQGVSPHGSATSSVYSGQDASPSEPGPLGAAGRALLEMVRKDPVVLFIGVATVAVATLALILFSIS
jgi:serine/threonine protein kinase